VAWQVDDGGFRRRRGRGADAGVGDASSVLPQPGASNSLAGVICSSAADCWAVGSTLGQNSVAEALHWNGASWTKPPVSGSQFESLRDLSCEGSQCMVVGTRNGITLALRFNGSKWVQVRTPNPKAGRGESLDAVSSTWTRHCWAFGSLYGPFAAHWNGHSWTTVAKPPKEIITYESVSGVSCASARDCVAVGSAGFSNPKPLSLHFNGSAWTRTPTPGPSSNTLNAIACPSTGECWAAGNGFGTDGNETTVALGFNGSKWRTY
jgi:hypothetical protein